MQKLTPNLSNGAFMLRIRWLKKALKNLEDAYNYLYLDSPSVALRFVEEVHDQTKLLITNPAMGRPGRVTGTRELVVAHFPYVIPYRLRGEEIQILRIFNTNQKPPIAW